MPSEILTMNKKPALLHAAVATLLLCIATVGYTYRMPEFPRFFAGLNDFLPRYTQARMVGSGDMYSIEAGYREQDRAVGRHPVADSAAWRHDRLPWQALLMAPLAQLPYLWAYWIWIGLNLAGFAALVAVWLLPRDLVLWGAAFLPAAAAFIVGQEGILLALGLAVVLRLAQTRRDVAAGLLLALCAIKPHLFVLIPLALIVHRRWRIASGAVIGTVGLWIAGTAAAGLDWPLRLLAIAQSVGQDASGDAGRRPSIFQLGINPWTLGFAVVLVVAFGFLVWRSRNLETGMALAILGGILIAPHTALYDLPLLLVALPLLPLQGYGKWFRYALYTPVPYWMLLNGYPWSLAVPILLLGVVAASYFNPGNLANPLVEPGEHADLERGLITA
jgi:hypothetical protein